jgi:isoquinoline 1-oxidoreductase alpha subunit
MISFLLNREKVSLDVEPDMPLLWVLREEIGLRGTKYGCGIGMCGACTVHLNGQAVRSCALPAAAADGQSITTIEALGSAREPHAIQRAWIDHQVPQCGYCQSGMQMAVASLLAANPSPTDDEIDAAVTNICRCGTYDRIRAAIHQAAQDS